MVNQKKAAPIKGAGIDPERQLIVQKSNPLYGLWRSELTLAEFKIIDAYLSRINSHDPSKRSVRFEKGEIERLLGVKKINLPELQTRLKHLGTMVPVDDTTRPKGFRLVSLFERADCEQDDNGVWQVVLTCTPSAMKYIFNIENIGYIKYKLRAITSLRSRYAYILFGYLEKNRHLHLSWEVSVDTLREILKADEPLYQEYKYFNAQLLKPVQKELSEKANCHFTYAPVKKGRTVKEVRFTLFSNVNFLADEEIPGQVKMSDVEDFPLIGDAKELDEERDDRCSLFADACKNEFSADEMAQILEILVTIPDWKLPPDNAAGGSIDLRRYHYLAERYAAMNRYKPKNRLKYLLKVLKSDANTDTD